MTKINVRARLNNNTLTDTYRRSGDKLRAFPVQTSVSFTTRQVTVITASAIKQTEHKHNFSAGCQRIQMSAVQSTVLSDDPI